MNEEFKKIEQSLERVRPSTLSLTQKEALWSRIQSRLNEAPVESPYMIFSSVMHVRVLVPALLVVLIVSTGATTALADSARPGDFLFAVDRAAERMRLSIVSETKKDDVRVAIADERVSELESLISEESSRRMARVDTTRNAKQAPAPQAEMALFATQVVVDEDTIAETGVASDDSIQVPENPRPEDVMMATNAEEPVMDEEASESELEDEDTEQRNKDIETALMLIGDISVELEEKGNAEGHARIEEALDRLQEKVDELPDEEEDIFKKNFESIRRDTDTIFLPDPSEESEKATTTIEIEVEGEVRGDSIEIDEKEIPSIELSRPKKDR